MLSILRKICRLIATKVKCRRLCNPIMIEASYSMTTVNYIQTLTVGSFQTSGFWWMQTMGMSKLQPGGRVTPFMVSGLVSTR